jgi:hypothetical protein
MNWCKYEGNSRFHMQGGPSFGSRVLCLWWECES